MLLGTALTAQQILGSLLVNVGAVACTHEVVSMSFNVASLFENTPPMPDSNHCISSLSLFRQAAVWDSHNAQAQGWLGMASLLQKKYVDAYDHWLSGLGMVPNNSVVEFRIGVALYKLGRSEDAIDKWQGLQAEGFFMGAGVAAREHGEFAQAEQYHRLVMIIAPDLVEAHLELAEDLFAWGKYDEALVEYRLGFAKPIKPSSVNLGEAAYHQAQIFSARGQYAEAISALEKAIAWHPGYPYYTGALGENYGRLGNYERAEYWLNETVRLAPTMGYPYWVYGRYYRHRQMFDWATIKFQEATRVEPEGAAYYYGDLGEAYLAGGHADLAVQPLLEALHRDPGNTTFKQWLEAAQATKKP